MCLYLPRHTGDVTGDDEPVVSTLQESAGEGEVVLVIDDEPTIRMLIGEVLAEAGYAVIEAPDGPAGFKILDSNSRIDLLITDVGLPKGMNGRQVADAARVNCPNLKVLFITGYAASARRRVIEGRRVVEAHEALVHKISARGGDATGAQHLLSAFKTTAALFESDLAYFQSIYSS